MGMHPKEAMMTLLVEAGADTKAIRNSNILHRAAVTGNVRMVQCLLDLGADPNVADRVGTRPVHMAAAAHSNGATVRCLLEAGQIIEIADNYGRTPLHVVAQCGRIESVIVLLEMGDVSSADNDGLSPLLYVLYNHGNEASVHCILHLGGLSMADQLCETQTCAAKTDTPDFIPSCQLAEPTHTTIEMQLAAGADIAQVNIFGDSPLRTSVDTTPFGPTIYRPSRPNYRIRGDYAIRNPIT